MVAVEPMGFGGPPRAAMTDEEWANLPEDEEGELVDGVLVEEEVGSWCHETAVFWLAGWLRSWAIPRRGYVGGSEIKYLLRPGRGRKPDVSMILPGSKAPPRRGAVRRAPDVIIEVVSPTPRDTHRDHVEKFAEYAAFGARYYWILNPFVQSFEIYELKANGYEMVLGASRGKLDNIPGCDGLMLDLDELWSELDRLSDEEPDDENPAQT